MQITPCKRIYGSIIVPGDKSISHRAVMMGALAEGDTRIYNFLNGHDCMSTISCFRRLGVAIEEKEDQIIVHGNGLKGLKKTDDVLYTGNSGTTFRIMMGILSGQDFESVLDGDESIRKRPMGRVADPLRMMGAIISGENGGNNAPIAIKGGYLKGIYYKMPVASAQVKSAIIMASLYAKGETIIEELLKSRDHTEIMLSYFGGDILVEGNRIITKPVERLLAQDVFVPGDISSAAYFMVVALIIPDSELTIRNVGLNPTRTGIIDVLRDMGAYIEIRNTKSVNNELVGDIYVRYSKLHGTTVSGDMIPRMIDEIPVLAVAACVADGITVIKDASELKVKESNRIRTISGGLKALGANVAETGDGMIIYGDSKRKFTGARVFSYNDHRVAMSMAVAALAANGDTVIEDFECVDISFPGFMDTVREITKK